MLEPEMGCGYGKVSYFGILGPFIIANTSSSSQRERESISSQPFTHETSVAGETA